MTQKKFPKLLNEALDMWFESKKQLSKADYEMIKHIVYQAGVVK